MTGPAWAPPRPPRLFLRRPDGTLGPAVVYRRLVYVERYNDVGKWSAVLPFTPQNLWAVEPGWGVVAQENGRTVLSGQQGGPDLESKVIEPADRTPGRIELQGEDDNGIIARNFAWPAPANPLSAQDVGYDVRTGQASTVLLAYLNANLGAAARAERRQPRVVLDPDPLIGGAVREQARFDNLITLCQSIGNKGGIGFRARADLDGIVHVSCYLPQQPPSGVRFSTALGNARGVTWSQAGGVSDLIGGGQGDLDARYFVLASNPGTRADWGYREGFYDYRNADSAQLQSDTNAKLIEEGPTRQASFTPIDTPEVRFDRDYGLGSLVTFEALAAGGAQTWQVPIREVEREWTRDGRKVTPRAGDMGATATTRRTLRERELMRRVERLERGA